MTQQASQRYASAAWKALVSAQDDEKNEHRDILTITGFMNHDQFMAHVRRYAPEFVEAGD